MGLDAREQMLYLSATFTALSTMLNRVNERGRGWYHFNGDGDLVVSQDLPLHSTAPNLSHERSQPCAG